METIVGSIGFTIPAQTLASSQEVTMTPGDVMAWRNRLPLADVGHSAKKIYHAITDCNKVALSVQERFEILELLRTPVQFICQSLRKHYINQTSTLTEQQLTIANLAQTLQQEMANGYKLIVEELEKKNDPESRAKILPIALQRIIHYLTYIIHRSYQLYSLAPSNTWKELHLVYQYADKYQLLNQNGIQNDYKRALLLAATYPFQWRQTEQDTLYTITEIWAPLVALRTDLPNVSEPGFLMVDFKDDTPPMSPSRGLIQFSATCKVLDVNPIIGRLKTLLAAIEPNELQARIAHSNDPEYAISTSILRGLIKEWEAPVTRLNDRENRSEQIKLCIGLIATHYYVNNRRPFQTQETNKESGFTFVETTENKPDNADENITSIELDKIPLTASPSQNISNINYPVYPCTLVNENPNGYGLIWPGDSYPPIQAGEIIGIARTQNGIDVWEVFKVRWLQHLSEFHLGVERLGTTAKAGGAQLLKEGKPAGYYLRCLLLEASILVPTLPFKSGSQIMVLQDESNAPIELELTQLVDATGSYKRFQFLSKRAPLTEAPSPPLEKPVIETKAEPKKENKDKDKFDSVWGNL